MGERLDTERTIGARLRPQGCAHGCAGCPRTRARSTLAGVDLPSLPLPTFLQGRGVPDAALLLGHDPHLGTVMDRLARVFGDRPLVTQPADPKTGVLALKLTYREAAARVEQISASIAALTVPGDRVVIAVPNEYRFLLVCLAAARAGCVAVPCNPQMRPAEIDHVIADSGATLVLRTEGDLPTGTGDGNRVNAPGAPSAPDDVAALFYTSGTTGKPKGVRLTHAALAGSLRGLGLPRWLRADEALLGLPVAHIYGFVGYLGLAAFGIASYVLPRFRPVEALDAIEARHPSVFLGVPAMYRLLLEAGAEQRDLKSIRLFASGADGLPDDIARTFQRLGAAACLPIIGPVGEAGFLEGYGMVELAGGALVKLRPPMPPGAGMLGVADLIAGLGMGVPVPGVSVRIVDDLGNDVSAAGQGELWVKSPSALKGYHGAPDATAAVLTPDGWVRTGDLVRRGPLGSVIFVGRAKDVIKSGGYAVYALEVERVLEEAPGVVEAAVLGVADALMGERVVAVVRVEVGSSVNGEDVRVFASDRLSAYKAPTEVKVVTDLPRTGTEKVQKRELRALFEA